MPEILNWKILANPANWAVVGLMLAIPIIGFTVIYAHWTR